MPKKQSIADRIKDMFSNVDIVTVSRGVVKDVYSDTKGNVLLDGPLSMDKAHCHNGAVLSDASIHQALRELQRGTRLSESSDIISFDGLNPIAKACKATRER